MPARGVPPARLRDLVALARPSHWIKNAVVILPILFGRRLADVGAWGRIGLAFAAFCLVSSAMYVVNDIRDRRADRLHPTKRGRPLAAGTVTVGVAIAAAAVLAVAGVILSAALGKLVLVLIIAYAGMHLAYSYGLKNRAIVDAIIIALGFVLRAAGGALAIRVAISPWLFSCTFTTCLFMGFCKRWSELQAMAGRDDARDHRATLGCYSPEFLATLITLSGAIAIIAFLAYAASAQTVARFGTDYLVYTLPLMVYAISRFMMLSIRATYADPTDLILHDRPFQLAAIAWLLATGGIIYYGPVLKAWIETNHV